MPTESGCKSMESKMAGEKVVGATQHGCGRAPEGALDVGGQGMGLGDQTRPHGAGLAHGELRLLVAEPQEVVSDASDDGEEVELPLVAGNLSLRMVAMGKRDSASTMEELNIESLDWKDKRGTKGKGLRARFQSDRQLRSSIFLKNSFQVLLVGNSNQHISLSISHPWLLGPMIFSFVLAMCTIEGRQELWANLLSDKPQALPWCIGGDFNVIVDATEKRGGRPFAMAEGVDFLAFMEEAEVFDAGFSGSSFTWCNNRRGRTRIWKRLYQFHINGESADLASAISVVHLARHPSDHAPLKISFAMRLDNGPRPFRFLNWNKQHFGNVGTTVREAEARLGKVEGNAVNSKLEEDTEELHRAQADLNRVLAIEKQFWRQKARVKWLNCGDRNTRFFQAVVKQRRVQGAIHRVKDSTETWVDKDNDIAKAAIEYFLDLFSRSMDSRTGGLMHLIPKVVKGEENELLAAVSNIEEVRRLVCTMDEDSAAGLDGFTGKFFSFAWDVIAQDVHRAIASFFCRSELSRFITSTSIVLLPKVLSPQDFSKFRPISLCNFFNKLLSRILELMSAIGKKARGGNVALKLDMTKAYNRMPWRYIVTMLRAFGFCEQFIDMVWRLISNVWFSIIINGTAHGYFKSNRGLRRGDLLSPVLFIRRCYREG
ncbi:uncharacterized protein LOC113757288 [Coffea eugenioides]|uniref:uncharacterized protein LOC113757288 n=1 Tax=Coffea eugenioides TaxID=49369 RepID=UPI000F60B876|nr:uncharacterized protein LOC113757288 [Coffea eugenioides]